MEIPRPKVWAYSKSSTGYPTLVFLDLFLASVYYTCNSTSLLLQVFTTTLQQSRGGGAGDGDRYLKSEIWAQILTSTLISRLGGNVLNSQASASLWYNEHPPGSLNCVSTKWLAWHRTHSNGCSIRFNFLFSTWPRGRSEVGRKGTEIHLRMARVHNSIF